MAYALLDGADRPLSSRPGTRVARAPPWPPTQLSRGSLIAVPHPRFKSILPSSGDGQLKPHLARFPDVVHPYPGWSPARASTNNLSLKVLLGP
eukprot:5886670-Pyramimonas_sp.AAC.1